MGWRRKTAKNLSIAGLRGENRNRELLEQETSPKDGNQVHYS
jgi:hypothetical protein